MTPYEALTTATVSPARALGQNTGTIEPGKLADIIVLDGNPLDDVANTRNVRRVIANGREYEMDELLTNP